MGRAPHPGRVTGPAEVDVRKARENTPAGRDGALPAGPGPMPPRGTRAAMPPIFLRPPDGRGRMTVPISRVIEGLIVTALRVPLPGGYPITMETEEKSADGYRETILGVWFSGDRENAVLGGLHAATGTEGRILVAQEMENAMDQEECHLPSQGMTARFRLACSGLDRNDHVTQKRRLRRWDAPQLRERQDIRGTIAVQVRTIEPPDGPVADEEH